MKMALPEPWFSRAALILGVFGMLFVTACSPTGQDTHATDQGQLAERHNQSNWSVSMHISGGFTGEMREISVDQTGQAVILDAKTKSKSGIQVTQNDLQTIAKLVKLLPGRISPTKKYHQCPDCRTYELLAHVDGRKIMSSTNDVNLQDSETKELVQLLLKIASEIKQQ